MATRRFQVDPRGVGLAAHRHPVRLGEAIAGSRPSALDYSDDGQMASDDTASTKGHVTTYTLTPLPRLPAPSSMASVRVPMDMEDDDEIKFKR